MGHNFLDIQYVLPHVAGVCDPQQYHRPRPAPGRAGACRLAQSLPPPGTEITKVIVYINNTYAYNCTVHRTQTNYKA